MKKNVMKTSLLLITSALLLAPAVSQASELKGAQVCEKIKTCALESLGDQEMTDQIKGILMTQLDQQCGVMFSEEKETQLKKAGLIDEANKCSDSMVAMPCDELMSAQTEAPSKACATFEKAAKEAGLDL